MEFGICTTWYFKQWEKFEQYDLPELRCSGVKRILFNILYMFIYIIVGCLYLISMPFQLMLPIIPITIDCVLDGVKGRDNNIHKQ